jgi:hypothetical protein
MDEHGHVDVQTQLRWNGRDGHDTWRGDAPRHLASNRRNKFLSFGRIIGGNIVDLRNVGKKRSGLSLPPFPTPHERCRDRPTSTAGCSGVRGLTDCSSFGIPIAYLEQDRASKPMVNSLVIRKSTSVSKRDRALRAAQYVRMSTHDLRYSKPGGDDCGQPVRACAKDVDGTAPAAFRRRDAAPVASAASSQGQA